MKKSISVIAVILSTMMLIASCGTGLGNSTPTPTPALTPNPELVKNTITATIELEDYDDITLELYPDLAPETVENFVELAEDGFYDGTIFHRVIENFMIQGGGYDENLNHQDTDTITGEFSANGFENTLSHVRGVISMARTSQSMDSASSQFFIVQEDSTYLDGQYAAFGIVTDGMDVVDEIASVKTGIVAANNMQNVPVEPIVIESITINTGSSSKSSSSKATRKPSAKSSDEEDEPTAKPSAKSSDEEDDEDLEDELELFLNQDSKSNSL